MYCFCLNQSLSKYKLILVAASKQQLLLESSDAQVWTSVLPHTKHTYTVICHVLAFTIQAIFAPTTTV